MVATAASKLHRSIHHIYQVAAICSTSNNGLLGHASKCSHTASLRQPRTNLSNSASPSSLGGTSFVSFTTFIIHYPFTSLLQA